MAHDPTPLVLGQCRTPQVVKEPPGLRGKPPAAGPSANPPWYPARWAYVKIISSRITMRWPTGKSCQKALLRTPWSRVGDDSVALVCGMLCQRRSGVATPPPGSQVGLVSGGPGSGSAGYMGGRAVGWGFARSGALRLSN